MRFVETSQERELYDVQFGLRCASEHRMPEAGQRDVKKQRMTGRTVGLRAA